MTLPLADLKIADFSWVGAGPRATKDLADLGATVVKIESRKRLDLGRLSPPFANDQRDLDGSAFFALSNTSKLSVAINLSDERGVAVARRLVQWADVVVENFSPGFMARIGLSYETLRTIKPDIIMVSVAGRSGPLSDLRGYGNAAAALSGLTALSGWPDRHPHMPPVAYGDVVAPMVTTVAILAALEHRRQSGEGQYIDVSQTESLIHTLADCYARQQHDESCKTANRSPLAAPHGAFSTHGYDQFIAIAVRSDAEWHRLAELLGCRDARFTSLAGRKQHEDELERILAAWTARFDKHQLADQLNALGIAAEAVADGRDVFTDTELLRGHYHRIEHSKLGVCDLPGPPLRFSDAEICVAPPPCLGEHQEYVLIGMLGMGREEVASLTSDGVLQ